MQRVVLIAIGRLKEPWAKQAASQYVERIGHGMKFEMKELPASRESDPLRQREDESRRMAEAAEKAGGAVFVLDETGERMTSLMFAKALQKLEDSGTPATFLLGGAYGFSDDVKRARKVIRLSDMTLPHELCRILFLEQLYRAREINRGSGYHHE